MAAAGDEALLDMPGRSGPGQAATSVPALAARALITLYQHTVGPMIPSSCRFLPTCSKYAYEALGTHGFLKGSWLGVRRIGRCHPLAKGGFDPVPERKA